MPWSARSALRFSAGAAVVLAAAYALSEAVDPVSPELRARVALFRERSAEVEAVAVGNSHGAAVDLDALGLRGMHFAMAGQDPFESAYLVRYAARAPRLRYVFFAASYGVQRSDHAVVGSVDLRARRRNLYARIPLQRPIPGDRNLWLQGMLAPIVRDDHWMGVLRRPFRPRPPVRVDRDGRSIAPAPPPPGQDSLFRYGAAVAALHGRLGAETVELAPGTPARVAATLDVLARELRGRDIVLVLYTPPYHESYLRAQDPAVVAETRVMMQRIVVDNPNALWLDYSADPRFARRDELFSNSDHLNPTGARAFSRLLRACLFGPGDAGGCPAGEGPVASAPSRAR